MWEQWGSKFGLPIDKAHRLYNSVLPPHKPWCSWHLSASCANET